MARHWYRASSADKGELSLREKQESFSKIKRTELFLKGFRSFDYPSIRNKFEIFQKVLDSFLVSEYDDKQ